MSQNLFKIIGMIEHNLMLDLVTVLKNSIKTQYSTKKLKKRVLLYAQESRAER